MRSKAGLLPLLPVLTNRRVFVASRFLWQDYRHSMKTKVLAANARLSSNAQVEVRILKELVSSGRKEKKGAGTPRAICKRVRKALMPNESAECSFLKSAEECEIRGVNFRLVLQESGRAKQK
jgi:hypothetical protein